VDKEEEHVADASEVQEERGEGEPLTGSGLHSQQLAHDRKEYTIFTRHKCKNNLNDWPLWLVIREQTHPEWTLNGTGEHQNKDAQGAPLHYFVFLVP
jgi:hypothetical protein